MWARCFTIEKMLLGQVSFMILVILVVLVNMMVVLMNIVVVMMDTMCWSIDNINMGKMFHHREDASGPGFFHDVDVGGVDIGDGHDVHNVIVDG